MKTETTSRRWFRRIGQGVLLALALWIAADWLLPRQNSIRDFDPAEVARMDTDMWKSYYRREPVRLLGQLAGALRTQFHAPFWRSWVLAFQAAKAAFDFKDGKSRADYEKTLPILTDYYKGIYALSAEPFDVARAANTELAWWIVHRERNHQPADALANALAEAAAALYNQKPADFQEYGRFRTEAMRIRDQSAERPGGTTDADWQQIQMLLNQSWASLHWAVHQ
jgi:hypothetical protein